MTDIDRSIAREERLIALIEEMVAAGITEARAFVIATEFIGIGRGTAAFRIKTIDDVHKLRHGDYGERACQ